jgi:hypothetical protein
VSADLTKIARTNRAFNDVMDERDAQDDSSDASHDPHVWIAKIAKHLGRAVSTDPVVFRRAMVVIAALAVAAIEWTDERFGTGA